MSLSEFRRIDIRLDKANDYIPQRIYAKEGDANGRNLYVKITDNGEVVDTTGISLNLGWTHLSTGGTGLDSFTAEDLSQGIYKHSFTTAFLQPGRVECSIQIVTGTDIVNSRTFIVDVDGSTYDETAVESDNSFTALQDALLTVSSYDGRILNLENTKAEQDYVEGEVDRIDAQLAQTALKLPRAVKFGELKLPDNFPKKVPFKVYKTREGYTHDFDFTPYEYSKKIYVSSSGTTSGDGLTPETATRNIDNLLTIISNVVEDNVSIVFLDKFFPMLFWQQNSIDFGKNIRLESAHEEGTVFGNFPAAAFTSLEYGLFKMTRNSVGKVLLYSVKDVWGNPSEALEMSSLTECQQTPNSFYTDDVDVWVNAPTESLETANENIGVLYRINFPLRFNIGSNTMFIDNVKFAREANKSRDSEGVRFTGTNQSMVIARNSYFNYGDRNGLETVNVGNVHLFNCQASQNLIDGFNYHGVGDELITEFNCYASDNGDDTQGSANATTAHDGMTILRIGSIGERCFGPVLADVNGCYSYNVGCAMYDSMNPDSYAFFFSETGAETPGAYYLIDCDADNPNGIDVVQNGGSPIKTRNSRFNTTTTGTEFEYI